MQTNKKANVEAGLVMVRWDRPGSSYHGQVHQVSQVLVDYVGCGRVVVWWPYGELVNRDGKTSVLYYNTVFFFLMKQYYGVRQTQKEKKR